MCLSRQGKRPHVLEIGSRIAMLIMALVPPITALLGFLTMRELISLPDFIGMVITILGIALVVIVKNPESKNFKLSHSIKGIVYAFIGAIGQSLGMIFSKIGMGSYNPFAATQRSDKGTGLLTQGRN